MTEFSRCIRLFAAALLFCCSGADAYDVPGFTPDQTVAYKQTVNSTGGSVTLHLHVFTPEGHQASDNRPAIVFFFGGGWVDGSPTQFHPHCEYLASRGMVAISAEYRVKNQHGTTPKECVRDGKSAVRYIREHAAELGIDPNRIAAGGGSAGGQVAAAAGTLSGYEEAGENLAVSSKPDALVLFNPVYDNGPNGYGYATVQAYWQGFSPMNNIGPSAPPTVVFLGTSDDLVPVATAENYKSLMEAAGRRCDLHLYEGEEHGFFNYDVPDDGNGPYTGYGDTVSKMDAFLVSLGYLAKISAGPITYVDAMEGGSGNTFATGGSLPNTTWVVAGGATANDTQWVKRTDAEVNGGSLFQALPSGSATAIPEIVTEIPGLPDGDYDIWAFYWDQVVNDAQNWVISAGFTSGNLATYSSPGEPAVTGAITTGVSDAADLVFSDPPPALESSDGLRKLFGVRLGKTTVSGASVVRVYVDMLPDISPSGTRVWYDGLGYARVSGGGGDPPVGAEERLFGIDFNRNDTLGSTSQSLFRVVAGSATQADNQASYAKTIGATQVTISQPDGEKLEFRGGNGDGTRAIPGGDTSRSFLVSDFIATRKGSIDLSLTGLAAGNYVFRSYHLDSFTGTGLGFAQGSSTVTPNTIEARMGGVVKATVQPTVLGANGLVTSFISDSQIPSISFAFTHDGSSPLVIGLRSTQSNGTDNFLLLNGFEILSAAP